MVPTLTDTQRRFLAAVMQRLPLERVHEVYLFSPLKQGGVETGVAVIAAGDEAQPPGPGDGALRAAEESDPTEAAAHDDAGAPDGATDDGTAEGVEATEAATPVASGDDVDPDAGACVVVGETVAAALAVGDEEGAVEALAVEAPEEALEDDARVSEGDDDAEASDGATGGTTGGATSDATGDAIDDAAEDSSAGTAAEPVSGPVSEDVSGPVNEAAAPPAPPSRFTIFTARYRLQLKGPDRGKWEVDVVEEADAPLVTVDAVVRGVQRRAGELSAVERLSSDDLAAALDDRPWARP